MKTSARIGESLTLGSLPTLDPPWPHGEPATVWQRQTQPEGKVWTDISGTVNQATYVMQTSDSFRNVRAKFCYSGGPGGARVNAFTQSVLCPEGVLPIGARWPLNSGSVYVAAYVTGTGEYGNVYEPDGMNDVGKTYYLLIGPRNQTELENYHPNDSTKWQLTDGLWNYPAGIPSDADVATLENKSYGRPFCEVYDQQFRGHAFLRPGYSGDEYGNMGPNHIERAKAIGGGQPWYIPARYECELLYKLFKPDSNNNITGTGNGVNPILDPPVTDDYVAYGSSMNPKRTTYKSFQQTKPNQFYGCTQTTNETQDYPYMMTTHEPGDMNHGGSSGVPTQSHKCQGILFRDGSRHQRFSTPQHGGSLLRAVRRESFEALTEYYEELAANGNS